MKALDPRVPVLVTGASSGIGRVFARRFAARGHDVVLVARREQRLKELAAELKHDHSVGADVLVADLSSDAGRDAVAARLRDSGGPWVLVNNAGFGTTGPFAKAKPERETDEINVNVMAVVQLALAALPGCLAARAGGILNVASLAGFQPLPYMATYGATKAFVLHFSEALAVECQGRGVRVTAFCPGPVRTEFGQVAGASTQLDWLFPTSAETCVDGAMKAFDRNRTIYIPGPASAVIAAGGQLVPRGLKRRAAAIALRGRR